MFDDSPIEVGRIQNGYLTDEQGRRIFFPPIGAPRLIEAPSDEANLRGKIEWSTGIGVFLAVAAILAIAFWPDGSGKGTTVAFVLVVGCRSLGASYFARRLPPLDDKSITYRRVVVMASLRWSYLRLCLVILLYVVGALGFFVSPALIWWPPVKWDVTAINELIAYGYVTPIICIGFALYLAFGVSRPIAALRYKRKGALPESF